MRPIRLIILATGCIIFTSCKNKQFNENHLPYFNNADFTPQWIKTAAAENIHIIPEFTFTNQDGRAITRADFDNKITVVNFFFTTCPGICKQLSTGMAQVQESFKTDDKVLLLSHSVTPEKDSVPVLKAYARDHGAISGKWHLVTGERATIYRLARTAYFADEDMGWKQDSSTFLHTENVLLIDKHHHIRGVYKGTIPLEVNNLVSDIKELEKEE